MIGKRASAVKFRKRIILVFYAGLVLFMCLRGGFTSVPVKAAQKYTSVYKGVDYSRVYDFNYYMKKYPKVRKKVGNDPKKAIRYFVKYGMKKQHQAIRTFNVKSYRYGNPSLRAKYRLNYKKYYLYYMRKGYKLKSAKKTRTGVTKMVEPAVIYKGIDYSALYDYFYYTEHNPDVVRAYKDDDVAVLGHYVEYGRKEGRKGKASSVSKSSSKSSSSAKKAASSDSLSVSSVKIQSCRISGREVVIKAETTLKKGTQVFLFAMRSYESKLNDSHKIATAKVTGTQLILRAPLRLGTKNSVLQSKFTVGIRSSSVYKRCSGYYYIQNPEAAASNKTAFPKSARGTKKGLKTLITSDAYIDKAVELKCSHVVVDFPLNAFLGQTGLSYTYEGKVYQFSGAILAYQQYLKKLRDKGIVVTGVFYLADSTKTQYMTPAAARGNRSRSATFQLNTQNSTRKELEALFSCLGKYFTSDGALVANWVFGNEADQFITYNYSGEVSYKNYIRYYADAFRMFNCAVKSQYANARTYLCFDHNWNLTTELTWSYRGREVLADINKYLKKQGAVHWDLALHPYPSPELDPRIWNVSDFVTDSGLTQQYTMMNMRSISAYIKKKYGSGVHIILPETGINSYYGGTDMQDEQAAAIALSYYLAEFDTNIDMIAIHREKDDPGETAGGFHVGIYSSSFSSPKKAAKVFQYMDTPSWKKYTKAYYKVVGCKNWKQIVKGFSGSRFTAA